MKARKTAVGPEHPDTLTSMSKCIYITESGAMGRRGKAGGASDGDIQDSTGPRASRRPDQHGYSGIYIPDGRRRKAGGAGNGDIQDITGPKASRHPDQHGQPGIYIPGSGTIDGGQKTGPFQQLIISQSPFVHPGPLCRRHLVPSKTLFTSRHVLSNSAVSYFFHTAITLIYLPSHTSPRRSLKVCPLGCGSLEAGSLIAQWQAKSLYSLIYDCIANAFHRISYVGPAGLSCLVVETFLLRILPLLGIFPFRSSLRLSGQLRVKSQYVLTCLVILNMKGCYYLIPIMLGSCTNRSDRIVYSK
jgi:hypothetical protein